MGNIQVKNKNYYIAMLAAMLLASPIVGAESKYPAADFKPTVVYKDESYKPTQSKSSNVAKQNAESDPNYPAANFQPKVVFKDDSYTPGKSTSAAKSTARPMQTTNSGQNASEKPAAVNSQGAESDSDYSLILVVLVIAGLIYFFNKKGVQSGGQGGAESAKYTRKSGTLTGVSRYLQDKEGGAVSGVAKYLEKQAQTSGTGVAKYLAKQAVSARKSANAQLSGVEKYLRDKG